jgi:SAM-dependent methyltransferase
MNRNLNYQTEEISKYFSKNRIHWDQFYNSEKTIISGLGLTKEKSVLDIGCGCGGLGLALREKFQVTEYTGVEINNLAARVGRELNPEAHILSGDFLEISKTNILGKQYNTVFSLSCFDWNIEFNQMLEAAWDHVAPGGQLVATFRIVNEIGCNDIRKSFQYINYDGQLSGEKAAYVVLNATDLLTKLMKIQPARITAYGYFGTPSETACTPYKKICFAAFSILKPEINIKSEIGMTLQLPEEILSSLKYYY